jgi:hypothetical protein
MLIIFLLLLVDYSSKVKRRYDSNIHAHKLPRLLYNSIMHMFRNACLFKLIRKINN